LQCFVRLPDDVAESAALARHKRLAALAAFIVLMMLGCGVAIGLSFWGGFPAFGRNRVNGCATAQR